MSVDNKIEKGGQVEAEVRSSLTRRDFIKIAALGVATTLASCGSPTEILNPPSGSIKEAGEVKKPVIKFPTEFAERDLWENTLPERKLEFEGIIKLDAIAADFYGSPALFTLSPEDSNGNVDSSIQQGFGFLYTKDETEIQRNLPIMSSFSYEESKQTIETFIGVGNTKESTETRKVFNLGAVGSDSKWKDTGYKLEANREDLQNPQIWLISPKGQREKLVDTPEFEGQKTPEPKRPGEIVEKILALDAIPMRAAEAEIPDELSALADKLGLEVQEDGKGYVFLKIDENKEENEVFKAREIENKGQKEWQTYWTMERVVEEEIKPFELTSSIVDFKFDGEQITTAGVVKDVGSAEFKHGENGWEISKGYLVFRDGEFNSEYASNLANQYQESILSGKSMFFQVTGWKSKNSDLEPEPVRKQMGKEGLILSLSPYTCDGKFGQIDTVLVSLQGGQIALPESNDSSVIHFIVPPETTVIKDHLSNSYLENGGLGEVVLGEPEMKLVSLENLDLSKKVWGLFGVKVQDVQEKIIKRSDVYYLEWKVSNSNNPNKQTSLKMFSVGTKNTNLTNNLDTTRFTLSDKTMDMVISKHGFYWMGMVESPRLDWVDVPWGHYLRCVVSSDSELKEINIKAENAIKMNKKTAGFTSHVQPMLSYLASNNIDGYSISTWLILNNEYLSEIRIIPSTFNAEYNGPDSTMKIGGKLFDNLTYLSGVFVHESGHALQYWRGNFSLNKSVYTEYPCYVMGYDTDKNSSLIAYAKKTIGIR